MAGSKRAPGDTEAKSTCIKEKKKKAPHTQTVFSFLYLRLPLTSLSSNLLFPFLPFAPRWPEGGCRAAGPSLSRPPVPCFMHEDDGAVIYSRGAPVSAPRHSSRALAGGGQVAGPRGGRAPALQAGLRSWGGGRGPHTLGHLIYLLLGLWHQAQGG